MQRLTQGLTNAKRINADRVNALRKTYESLMDDERRRKDRNEQIIGILDKMRRSSTVALRSPLTKPYDDYQLLNISPTSHISDDLRRLKFNDTNQAQPFVPAIIHNINEDIILKEMSKKYIIIPKLMHANVTLQSEKGFDSTSSITASNEAEDWRRKYEILNQIQTNKETDDTRPYLTKAERDETNHEDKLLLVSKSNGESEYSTVTKIVSNAELTNTIKIIAPTNSVNDLAQSRSANEEELTENIDAIEYESQLQLPEGESNQCEIIYANVTNANSELKVSFDNDQPCTEHKTPDNVSIDQQKPKLRTYDDQEEEINEIESNLRFDKEHSIPHNENIAPVRTLHNENNSNDPSENYDCKRESPDNLMAYEANTAEYQNSEISLTETQNIDNSPNTNNEVQHQKYEYHNIDVNESSPYQNSDVNYFGENENNEVQPTAYENYGTTNQDNEAVENQYENYDMQEDGSGGNYSNPYLAYETDQSTVEQEQIDEFNEENNTMFYSENDAVVYQQPEEQQQQPQEFNEKQYVFDTDNEAMQPYDQSYEQQYSELGYDTTQESSNTLPYQGDFKEIAITEMQEQFNVEQIKNELDTEEGLNVPEKPATQV